MLYGNFSFFNKFDKLNPLILMIEKLESIIFQNKTKDQLIEETLTSLSGLLANIFTGDDLNELKKEFPDGIKIEDIGIQLRDVALYLSSKEFEVPCIEVAIDLIHEKQEFEIGTYSLIFNEDDEQIDEILDLN